ncbi:MAG: DUF167 domain-containing protein [Patescibacteria group bacterium]
MRIFVRVKANSKIEKIQKIDEKNFIISVKAPAQENKANEAIIKTLANYFGVPKSQVTILSGQKSKSKIIEIL